MLKKIPGLPLKILYVAVMTLSALIVVGFLIFYFLTRPPKTDESGVPSLPPIVNEEGQGSPEPDKRQDVSPTASPSEAQQALHRRSETYTCLIFGMDDGNGNTDTIMAATFDVPNHKIGLVSIPRDLVVRLDKKTAWNKVSTAYAAGGVEQLVGEVKELLGIPIDFYVKINLKAFKNLVDAVGGVYFNVPFHMKYTDPTQNLYIDQPAGYRLLSGEDAMEVVRFRQSNTDSSFSDIGRVGVQQAFLKAMLSQIVSNASLSTLPTLVDTLMKYVKTNASVSNALYFAKSLIGVDMNSAVSTAMLPSAWHNPYMWVKPEEALDTVNQLLNPYEEDITMDMVEFLRR